MSMVISVCSLPTSSLQRIPKVLKQELTKEYLQHERPLSLVFTTGVLVLTKCIVFFLFV